jgi:two-component system, OmpR family, heavy metal sensor histidine kinase CusS
MKIRKKLTLQFTILVATIVVCFSLAVYFLYGVFREQEFYKRLEAKANLLGNLLISHNDLNKEVLNQIDRKNLATVVDEQELIYNSQNQQIFKNDTRLDFTPTPYLLSQVRQRKEVEFTYNEMEGVGFLYQTPNNDEFVIFALGYDLYGFNKLEKLRWILIVGNVIAIAIVMVTGYWFAVSALRPIANIVTQVDNISASNLSMRLETKNFTDEIGQVAKTFNKMLDRVEYAFELQKSFVSGASHELRTPLTIIQGNLEVSLMQDKTLDETQESLKIVLSEIKKMTELTNGLLNMARMTENHSDLKMGETRIDEVLLDLLSIFKQKHPEKKINFIFDETFENLEDFNIQGNEYLLKIALGNILENACKYSQNERIDVKLFASFQNIKVTIIDYGMGIDKEDLECIQLPFFRGKNTGKITGFGIGLSLTRRIIAIHQGKMNIESEVGKGTQIEIIFPLLHPKEENKEIAVTENYNFRR